MPIDILHAALEIHTVLTGYQGMGVDSGGRGFHARIADPFYNDMYLAPMMSVSLHHDFPDAAYDDGSAGTDMKRLAGDVQEHSRYLQINIEKDSNGLIFFNAYGTSNGRIIVNHESDDQLELSEIIFDFVYAVSPEISLRAADNCLDRQARRSETPPPPQEPVKNNIVILRPRNPDDPAPK